MNISDTSGPQQFLVEHGGRLYVTAVAEEADPQDPRFQGAFGDGSSAGRAVPYEQISYKSMESGAEGSPEAASFGNINEANFGNINPDQT